MALTAVGGGKAAVGSNGCPASLSFYSAWDDAVKLLPVIMVGIIPVYLWRPEYNTGIIPV